MKAIVQHRYGSPDDVLELQDIEKPAAGDDEVLVRVHATTVAGDDWHIMRGLPYVGRPAIGLFKPKQKIPGLDVAGRVEAVGKNVEQFQPGDEVFGWCKGAFAEYVSVPEGALAPKPANLTFEQAAVVPIVGFTALQGLRDKGGIRPRQKILVVGASGGVGTFAVQIAKSFGAEVTGVCSTPNVDMVRSIGADHVIDYTQEDFTQSGQRYDLILDLAGNRSLSDCRRALSPKGTLVMAGSSGDPRLRVIRLWLKGLLLSPFVGQRLRPLIHKDSKEDLATLKELLESGKVTPVVVAQYPLSEVPEAIRHFEAGHARGKIVITV